VEQLSVVEQPALNFAGLLRQLRTEAGRTQEQLAQAAGLSPRSVSDLERGVNRTARRDTARLLADALELAGTQRALFEAAASGRVPAPQVPHAGAGTAATRTLPRDIASFTGRAAQLAQVIAAATGAAAAGGVVGIWAVSGMAGIGKTAFAVHAAHELAGEFPDGQFFLSLHAHTPGQRPVDPVDALANLLLSVGVGAQQIPPGLPARAALWRSYLSGKKVLVLLDDAASHEQVTPLLPGTAGSVVLVTSRRRLTALQDVAAISLDILKPDEAATLLARLAARPDLSPDDETVAELARLCGYLPLAIGMLARQLHHHPAWTATSLAAELATAVNRLELMHAENLSVAAAFDLSYQDLTPGQRRLFRRLGAHPGTDIDSYAAAALDDIDLVSARRDLDSIYDHYLLTEPVRGRYRLHDLLREHARGLAAADDPADTDAALQRLLDYYVHTAAAAGRHIETRNTTMERPLPGNPPAITPPPATTAWASAWLDAERANLNAAVAVAADSARAGHATAIPAAINGFLFAQGHWDQAAALQSAALTAARRAGDRAGQADALNELGSLQLATGGHTAAAASHQQALELYLGLDDRLGQASTLDRLGRLQRETGGYTAAITSHQQALALYHDLDHQTGQACAFTGLGNAQARIGDYRAAATSHQQALRIFLDIGHRLGQATATGNLGNVQARTGDYPAGDASLTQALGIYRALGDRLGQAQALTNLGAVRSRAGDYAAAAVSHQQALDIFCELGDRRSQAGAIGRLAVLRSSLSGDYRAAVAGLTHALDMYRELGDRGSEAEVLNDLGEVLARSPDNHQAGDYHTRALAIAREISTPLEKARALEGIGHRLLRDGSSDDAIAHWNQALTVYEQIGAPDARRVREALHQHSITTASLPAVTSPPHPEWAGNP
jgi:tetratricopeptide (TPR) repeat protein/transcriptional regulator with XRE-family HTH domain